MQLRKRCILVVVTLPMVAIHDRLLLLLPLLPLLLPALLTRLAQQQQVLLSIHSTVHLQMVQRTTTITVLTTTTTLTPLVYHLPTKAQILACSSCNLMRGESSAVVKIQLL